MVYEYAIDPRLLAACSDKMHIRLLTKSFGLGTPRIHSLCPRVSKWKTMVRESFSKRNEAGELADEKQRANLQFDEHRLTALTQHLIDSSIRRPNFPWNPDESWLDNALSQHAKNPFRGLLSSEPSMGCIEVINQDNLDAEDHPSWLVDEQVDVPSNPPEMAMCLDPLLRMAKHIIFIEPYFRSHRRKWNRTFNEFFRSISASYWEMSAITLEIHASRDVEKAPSAEHFKEECTEYMPGIIPLGLQVKFFRWSQIPGDAELHNRYVLTDLGGVKVDPGFDERGSRGATTEFILLREELYRKRWDQYANGSAFQLAEDPFSIVGKKN